ncbi:MAG: hypothetical protein A4S09_03210 [Proteobacteria bacterium SG_bin7]|nr:MAG: hypothetical protein A4S09_03210 [Proteobacteria bacterium SG_bin7]
MKEGFMKKLIFILIASTSIPASANHHVVMYSEDRQNYTADSEKLRTVMASGSKEGQCLLGISDALKIIKNQNPPQSLEDLEIGVSDGGTSPRTLESFVNLTVSYKNSRVSASIIHPFQNNCTTKTQELIYNAKENYKIMQSYKDKAPNAIEIFERARQSH